MTSIYHYEDDYDIPAKWYDGIITTAILVISAAFFVITMVIGVHRS